MRPPIQAVPVLRTRRTARAAHGAGILPQANNQCWTDYGCGGLAFSYVDDCAQCRAQGGKSIRNMLDRSCTNC